MLSIHHGDFIMIRFALVGATGLVGRTAIQILEGKNWSQFSYTFFASSRSAGKKNYFFQ